MPPAFSPYQHLPSLALLALEVSQTDGHENSDQDSYDSDDVEALGNCLGNGHTLNLAKLRRKGKEHGQGDEGPTAGEDPNEAGERRGLAGPFFVFRGSCNGRV